MLEDTTTMGSMESSLREKRLWAIDSALYNLKNDTFREIFPSLSKKLYEGLTEAQKRRLKEDFIKRKVKLDALPGLQEVQLETTGSGGGGEAANGDCDKNNNTGKQGGAGGATAAAGGAEGNMAAGGGGANANGGGWSMNILILVVIIAGLVINYVLKSNNFYD